MNEREPVARINLYDLLLLIARWKKVFIINVGVVTIVAVIIALILPVWFAATTVILPPSSGGGLPSFLPQDLASVATTFGLQSPTDEIYQSILESRTLKQAVIDRFNLRKVYNIPDDTPPEDVIYVLEGLVKVTTRPDMTIEVKVFDRDPERAAAIANGCVEELDRIYSQISALSAHKNRLFIERRLQAVNDSLRAIQDSLVAFQSQTNTISLSEQVQAMILAVAEIKAQQLATEVEVELFKSNFGPQHPMVGQLTKRVQQLEANYESILNGRESDLFLNLQSLPDISRRYADLMRKGRIMNLLVEYIYPQYESALYQEKKETADIQVLDRAVPPKKKAKPPRKIIVLLAMLAASVTTLIYVLVREYLERLPSRNPEDYAKLTRLKRLINQWKP